MAQVEIDHYKFHNYETLKRFASYWHQIDMVLRVKPKDILEIGGGTGFCRNALIRYGVNVTTVDFDQQLQPNCICDVRALPFADNTYDAVVAFQVLEHLKWDEFRKSLYELRRVARQNVIISLPDSGGYIKGLIRIPWIGELRIFLRLDWIYRKEHKFKGQHYWEINKAGFSVKRILQELESEGWSVTCNKRIFENPYHRFFCIEKTHKQKELDI
jgi:ubiquinone/menaquinone biosynthesis C-methylase UbiE